MADKPTLHDARRVFHFWMDDEIIDTYGPIIGPYGITVYAYLARRSKLQQSFPSHGRIARDTGMSRRKVILVLEQLITEKLVTVTCRTTELGDKDTNLYTIEDLGHIHGRGSAPHAQPSAPHAQGVVHHMHNGSAPHAHEVFSLKDSQLKGEREERISGAEILSGTDNGVVEPEDKLVHASEMATPHKKKRQKTPLADDDWLREQLMIYRDDFDFDALNDDEWWSNLGNSFPDFDRSWVKLGFASLARWLSDNKKRRPRTSRGWKQRMNFSLNWYYDKHMRRTSHV